MNASYFTPGTNKKLLANNTCFLFIILLSVFSVLIPGKLKAQNTYTLSQAINNGLANKQNITSGRVDLSISKLQTEALYRKYWPQVSAEYSYMYNPILPTSIFPIGAFNPSYPPDATQNIQFGTNWSQTAGLTAIQPLLDVSINRNIDEAKMNERIAALSQARDEYDLANTIAETYIDICLQESNIKIAIEDTNRTFVTYTLMKNKFDQQTLLKSDLNRSKINHNNAIQKVRDAITLLIENKVYLLYLMGINEIEKWDFEVDSNFIQNDLIGIFDSPPSFDQLPDLQALELQSQLSAFQAKLEKGKYVPTLNLKGFIGANQFTNNFNPVEANTWYGLSYVGLVANFPLLIGENKQKKLSEYSMQSQQYALQKADKTAEYQKDIYTAQLRISNLQEQLKIQEENIELIKELIEIIQERAVSGQESASTLNLEEADLQEMEAEYQGNRKELWVYWLNYLKASGKLTQLWQ